MKLIKDLNIIVTNINKFPTNTMDRTFIDNILFCIILEAAESAFIFVD